VNEAKIPPARGARERLGRSRVAAIIVGGCEGLGDAGKVDDDVDAAEGVGNSVAGCEVAGSDLDRRRKIQRAARPGRTAGSLTGGSESLHEVAADEPGSSRDENHHSGALRKATSPK